MNGSKIWKIVYELVQFSIWEVYEWVCCFFLNFAVFKNEVGSGILVARPYPK